ncbi:MULTISPECIES: TRAP transporter substrate-binding protein [unclassified Jeotgalibaca]|uniref:TRAP transporter substrate-binding protein n=1 Tax=unclassified Jeotgalibaca TaxID=2621505 RepID=UPI003FD3D222
MKKKITLMLTAFIATTLAGCGLVSGKTNENQPEYVINYAHGAADVASLHQGAVKFKELVEEGSDGRIKVQIYPNSQLGGDRELMEGVQFGDITVMNSNAAVQVNFVPGAAVFDLHFLFQDLEHARATNSDPEFVAKLSKEYEEAGFKFLGTADQGFRIMTANEVITEPEQMAGKTIRVIENQFHIAAWSAIGASPTPMPFNELYTALQQGTVDTQETPIELIYSQKFYEQQDYFIMTNHLLQTIPWAMNLEFYNELPEDLQELVSESATEAISYSNEYLDANIEEMTQEIVDYGIEIIELTPEQQQSFAEKAQSVYGQIEAAVDPGIYEAYINAADKNAK